MTGREERAKNRVYRRWQRDTPLAQRSLRPWCPAVHNSLEAGPPVSSRVAAHAAAKSAPKSWAAQRRFKDWALRTALMIQYPVRVQARDDPTRPIVANRTGAAFGPGPRCRFCLVLLRSWEWQLERCEAHWDADIADCPATEYSLANFVSSHACQ